MNTARLLAVKGAAALCAAACGGEFHDLIPRLDLSDPLTCAKAYSVEIDEHVNGTDGFFPLGVLGERFTQGFNVAVGGNYVCHGIRSDAPTSRAAGGCSATCGSPRRGATSCGPTAR